MSQNGIAQPGVGKAGQHRALHGGDHLPGDALYPNREYLPAKVRALIDLLIKNFRQIDWDPLCGSKEASNNSVIQAISSSKPRTAPKQPSRG
jgi:hypothetical protein